MKRAPTGDLLARIDGAIAETRALARARTATAVERTLRTASRSYHSSHCDYECLLQHREASPTGGTLWQVPTRDRWRYHPWEISPHLFDPPDPDEEPDPERVAGLQARVNDIPPVVWQCGDGHPCPLCDRQGDGHTHDLPRTSPGFTAPYSGTFTVNWAALA